MSFYLDINAPISSYTTRLLNMYLKFPENEPFTALDWRAGRGEFLDMLTRGQENRKLYGVESNRYDATYLRNSGKFEKIAESHYRSEARITNDVFSLMVVNPDIDDRLIDEVFNTVDPYNMPNFEEEIRAKVAREEEERKRLQEEMKNQIDFGSLNEDGTEQANGLLNETEEEAQERIENKMKLELEKRIKAWRLAMREQQKKMAGMRWDAFLLQRATTYLRPGGILVFITPKEFIDDTISHKLVNQFEDIRIMRLEDEEYREQRKCIILAKKRKKPTREEYNLGRMISRTKERPYKSFGKVRDITVSPEDETYDYQLMLQEVDKLYSVIEPQVQPLYEVPPSDPEEIESFRVGPITGGEALLSLKKSKLIESYQEKYVQAFVDKNPVAPTELHKGHIMLLLTSGFLNGYIGTGPDQHLVKGTAIKDVREFTETDEDGSTRIVEREYYNIGVKLLNGKGEFRKIM